MFTLDKLPAPVQALLAGVPAMTLIQLFSRLSPYAGKPVEAVPVDLVSEMFQALDIQGGPQALQAVTQHMAQNPKELLGEWFTRASSDGLIEPPMRPQENQILHRCYFCHQPNLITLPS